MIEWKPVEECTVRDSRKVLAAFEWQFGWVVFTAHAHPEQYGGLCSPQYAKPTHFAEINTP